MRPCFMALIAAIFLTVKVFSSKWAVVVALVAFSLQLCYHDFFNYHFYMSSYSSDYIIIRFLILIFVFLKVFQKFYSHAS